MVRIVALGLLISGITPITFADSSDLSVQNKPDTVSSLKVFCEKLGEDSTCPTSTDNIQLGIHSDLWLRGIAQSLYSPFLLCDRRSPSLGQNKFLKLSPISKRASWRTNLTRSSLDTITSPNCSFSWQQQLNQQLVSLESEPIQTDTINLEQNSINKYIAYPKFPQLSRSSLIVDFPEENSNFVPVNRKLANPAPQTKRIASPFGWRRRPYSNQLQFHQGIDYGAPFGSTVVSVGNGIVTRVVQGCADFGNLFCGGQLGNWIEVDHGNGMIGTYGHLKRSSITIQEGARVRKNQPIAQVGSSGWSTGAHLDFRMKVNGKHENPANYVMAIHPTPAESVER